MLVETSYVTGKPAAFAVHAEHRLGLHNPTSTLFVSVFAGVNQHAFVAALLAVLSFVTFGLGFGRVLTARPCPRVGDRPSQERDHRPNPLPGRFGCDARHEPRLPTPAKIPRPLSLDRVDTRPRVVRDPAWILHLGAAPAPPPPDRNAPARPRGGLHRTWANRRRIASNFVLARWLDSYSKTYGALGIVMGILFWIIAAATVLVLAAALSPALAHRRDLLDARHQPESPSS